MSALLNWLTSSEWTLVVKALLHSLWQGALIAAGLALVLRRVANPAARYRLALTGLGVVFAAAVVTWAMLNAPNKSAPNIAALPVTAVEPAPAVSDPVQKIVVLANRTPVKAQAQWTAWLALAWLIGASAMLGRASVKIAGAEQLRRSCRPLDDERINMLVSEAKRAVKLTRQIRVAVTDQLISPAAVGVLVPTLVLPLLLVTTLAPEQIRFVLLHELAHIRRGDYLANLFQLFAESLLFFNPAVWWLSHQVRREREACCDALAIELSGAPAEYARTLVSVAEAMLHPAPAAAPAFGNEREPSSLADRVQRVLVPDYRPSLRLTWRSMLAALVMGGVLLGLLAAGARETIAATTTLLEPKTAATNSPPKASNSEAKQLPAINPATGLPAAPSGSPPKINPATGLPESIGASLPGVINPATGLPAGATSAASSPEKSGTDLFKRIFKVDSNVFARAFGVLEPVTTSNLQAAVRNFFSEVGVDFKAPGKAVFYNDRQGTLWVRATLADLDIVEQALEVMNTAPPQVNIRARFVEVPMSEGGAFSGNWGLASTNLVSQPQFAGKYSLTSNLLTGILTPAQFKVALRALEQREGVEILSTPSVTTVSGRQAQIQIEDIRTVVTGVVPMVTNGITTNVLQTTALPFGPTLDVVPYVSADGYTVQMTLIPTVTEFLGYDKPDAALTNYPIQNLTGAELPLPHYRLRQAVTQANVWDGQTIVIGGFSAEIVTRHANGSTTKVPDPKPQKKQLYVFITPTIIDPAGNRVHTDEEMAGKVGVAPKSNPVFPGTPR